MNLINNYQQSLDNQISETLSLVTYYEGELKNLTEDEKKAY